VTTCRCGHGPHAHEHYRRGKDCSLCACAKFRSSEGSILARLLGRRAARREVVVEPATPAPAVESQQQHEPEPEPEQQSPQRHSIAS
jgi:hypothetical protein